MSTHQQAPVPGSASVTLPLLPPRIPHAVVFDCDGTLVDFAPCIRRAYTAVFARRHRICDDDTYVALRGLTTPQTAEVIAGRFGEPVPAMTDELTDELCAAVVWARPLPGAVELVRRFATMMPVAVASNAPRALLDRTLTYSGLANLVPVTVAADEVACGKPAPDLYLAACRALDVPPSTALAVEDTTVGIHAAHTAGMTVLAVGDPPLCHHADAYVPRLDHPSLATWIVT